MFASVSESLDSLGKVELLRDRMQSDAVTKILEQLRRDWRRQRTTSLSQVSAVGEEVLVRLSIQRPHEKSALTMIVRTHNSPIARTRG
jgi:hypothetical protein